VKIAIIPARGGSKRIPGKNIRPFLGKPIIGYSIEAALASKCFEKVIVSTDDETIASVARDFGANVPFIRPAHLSDDHATTGSVIAHAVEWMNLSENRIDIACCIYATAPFVQAADLIRGLEKLESSGAEYVISATSYPYPIQRGIRITNKDRVEMLEPNYALTRSQDLEPVYHDAGQFYWGKASAFLSETTIISPSSSAILIPQYRVQDIDTVEDWLNAEIMYHALKEINK